MSDKDNENEFRTQILLTELMVRVKVIEKILVNKGLTTDNELGIEYLSLANLISKSILERAAELKKDNKK